MSAASPAVHLAVALEGAGWHPAAWREPRARPTSCSRPLLGGPDPGGRARPARFRDHRGRARPAVRPPFRAGLAHRPGARAPRRGADRGQGRTADQPHRAGSDGGGDAHRAVPHLQGDRHARLRQHRQGRAAGAGHGAAARGGALRPPQFPARRPEGPLRPAGPELVAELFDEAADYVEVVRRLWDSWEDDAEIRDAATGRFIDRDKLHYIDFGGDYFSVKGPSITPRPPQGQPVVSALGHASVPYQLIARSTDVGFVTPRDAGHAAAIVAEIRDAQQAAGRSGDTVHVFGDLVVFLDEPGGEPGPNARPASTSSPDTPTPATRSSSPGRRSAWPTCCWTGRRAG